MATAPAIAPPVLTALDIELEAALARFPEGRVSFRRTSIADANAAMRWSADVYTADTSGVTEYDELPSVALDKAIAEWRAKYPNPEAIRTAEIERLRTRLAILEGGKS